MRAFAGFAFELLRLVRAFAVFAFKLLTCVRTFAIFALKLLKLVSKNKTAFSHSKDAVISQLCFFNPNHAKPM